MVSVSQPALAPQCSVSVHLFPFVASPAYVCDAGVRRLPITGMRSDPLCFLTFCSILCLYSFHSLCVCNICMFVLNVPVAATNWMFLCNHAPEPRASRPCKYHLPQSQKYFVLIYLSRLLCLYIYS